MRIHTHTEGYEEIQQEFHAALESLRHFTLSMLEMNLEKLYRSKKQYRMLIMMMNINLFYDMFYICAMRFVSLVRIVLIMECTCIYNVIMYVRFKL